MRDYLKNFRDHFPQHPSLPRAMLGLCELAIILEDGSTAKTALVDALECKPELAEDPEFQRLAASLSFDPTV